ncbi:MAG: alpha/beta hydrolase [Dehalococcoidales bacterium]|nr:alpha/beta hydrolase [Dehalococcoidales bacterium]
MIESLHNIAYAEKSARQKLDIYFPSSLAGPWPVILFLHPGGFTEGSKDMVKYLLNTSLNKGYAVVAANYRLANEALFPAQIYDAKASVRWIRANASLYNLNPAKIAAWGISAGSVLASLLGTTAGVKELEDLSMGNPFQSSGINAVVALISPMDFNNIDSQLVSMGKMPIHDNETTGLSLILGGKLSIYPKRGATISPMTYISADSVPFYLQAGTADEIVPYLQSVNFAKALTAAIGKENVVLNLVENANHFDSIHYSRENLDKALSFLDKHLRT